MRVLMIPDLEQAKRGESGINTVVRAYAKHLPAYDIELVPIGTDGFDMLAIHAGLALKHPLGVPTTAHTHGLYWSADYASQAWEYKANANVIRNVRHANEITVPSEWVAETFRRDMHRNPHVVRHGIDWEDWQHDNEPSDYVLWNKNRAGVDVCDPTAVGELARRFPKGRFVTTFAARGDEQLSNVNAIGVVPHDQMRVLIQHALVYLSTTKETFGISSLEAMASGVPVLGWDCGGNKITVRHGVNGYLAPTGDYDALAEGLAYCLKHRATLGANGREMARAYDWQSVAEQVAGIYRLAAAPQSPTVAVVIPSFNYADKVGRAVASACAQTYGQLTDIIVVDDGSTEGDTRAVVAEWTERDNRVRYIYQDNAGVAHARNRGIDQVRTKYVACLDADDKMGPDFLAACIPALEADRSFGIAYAGIWWRTPDGNEGASVWPGEFDYDGQLEYRNSVPTCCVFRREMWAQLGGYRQRYAPEGAGAEDGEFWVRCGAAGWGAKKVAPSESMVQLTENLYRALKRPPRSDELLQAIPEDELEREKRPMFHYSMASGRVSGNPNYRQVPYLEWHPWAEDGLHPFASVATPRKFAHPVRQYDEPAVSVIIPVGPGHEHEVINALDSLNAQTFRKWEVVVVWDAGGHPPQSLVNAYPYVTWYPTEGQQGAGFARNRGMEVAHAPLILYLDADDQFYHPEALETMIAAWHETGAAIYSDFLGAAYIADEDIQRLDPKLQKRIYESKEDGRRVIGYRQFDYDCERAQRQPEEPKPYIWCNITTLFPKAWHDEIGGFDEAMPSWEDVDYWWRMARLGKCFIRLPAERPGDELFLYRFYSGGRRDAGAAEYDQLITYTREKYKELPMVRGCANCGRRTARTQRAQRPPPRSVRELYSQKMAAQQMPDTIGALTFSDDDFIMCNYKHRSVGQQHTFGHHGWEARASNMPMQKMPDGLWHIHYGYRRGGDRFLVHRLDVQAAPHLYEPVQLEVPIEQPAAPPPPPPEPLPVVETEPAPPPVPVERDAVEHPILSQLTPLKLFDLAALPGITPALAEQMRDDGVDSLDGVLGLGVEGLSRYKGIAERRAQAVLAYAQQEKERQDAAD